MYGNSSYRADIKPHLNAKRYYFQILLFHLDTTFLDSFLETRSIWQIPIAVIGLLVQWNFHDWRFLRGYLLTDVTERAAHTGNRHAATAHNHGRRIAERGGVKPLNTVCSTMWKSEGEKNYKKELKLILVLKKLLFIIAPVKSEALELICCQDYKKKKMFRLLKFRFFFKLQ